MVERGYLSGAIVKKTTKKYPVRPSKPYDLWAVVEHIAEGGAGSWVWLQTTGPGSSHFFVTKKGETYQFASIYERTWANGLSYKDGQYIDPQGDIVVPPWWRCQQFRGIDPNLYTISVEHEGWVKDVRTAAMIEADKVILQFIKHETGIVYKVGDTLIRHADISPENRSFCPGPNFDMNALAIVANGVDPIRVRVIKSTTGQSWYCGTGFFEYYHQFGGLRAFGNPLSDEYPTFDLMNEPVTIMKFERQWVKFKPSETPWSIRPMLLSEVKMMEGLKR